MERPLSQIPSQILSISLFVSLQELDGLRMELADRQATARRLAEEPFLAIETWEAT